jgi:hypothetical protein
MLSRRVIAYYGLIRDSILGLTTRISGNFQQVTINTGGILLTPNDNYVALLTTTDPGSIAANANSFGFWSFGGL